MDISKLSGRDFPGGHVVRMLGFGLSFFLLILFSLTHLTLSDKLCLTFEVKKRIKLKAQLTIISIISS